jgi:hypothetical protein
MVAVVPGAIKFSLMYFSALTLASSGFKVLVRGAISNLLHPLRTTAMTATNANDFASFCNIDFKGLPES